MTKSEELAFQRDSSRQFLMECTTVDEKVTEELLMIILNLIVYMQLASLNDLATIYNSRSK